MNPQQMMTEAFDKRMKAKKFPNEGALAHLRKRFEFCLHNFSLNSLKFNSKELLDILGAEGSLTYYQTGLMIQVVKAVSMKMHGIESIIGIADFMAEMEAIEAEFAEFANKTVQDAEREVKAKLKALENAPSGNGVPKLSVSKN